MLCVWKYDAFCSETCTCQLYNHADYPFGIVHSLWRICGSPKEGPRIQVDGATMVQCKDCGVEIPPERLFLLGMDKER